MNTVKIVAAAILLLGLAACGQVAEEEMEMEMEDAMEDMVMEEESMGKA
ncbi:MAG: hypothetical protein OXF88_04170 [Rhodobacteraceae bacterium]|nr:hypothetical protein [Paracoccaceae bacterium]MCY4137582.1 hypothetical protein [Paracoccaceae bacterium]